jgi:hypothetical protein
MIWSLGRWTVGEVATDASLRCQASTSCWPPSMEPGMYSQIFATIATMLREMFHPHPKFELNSG